MICLFYFRTSVGPRLRKKTDCFAVSFVIKCQQKTEKLQLRAGLLIVRKTERRPRNETENKKTKQNNNKTNKQINRPANKEP